MSLGSQQHQSKFAVLHTDTNSIIVPLTSIPPSSARPWRGLFLPSACTRSHDDQASSANMPLSASAMRAKPRVSSTKETQCNRVWLVARLIIWVDVGGIHRIEHESTVVRVPRSIRVGRYSKIAGMLAERRKASKRHGWRCNISIWIHAVYCEN